MKEVTLYGGTIDSCLKDLREMAAADESGEVLEAVFNDKYLLSTDTDDDAYLRITGKTKAEYDEYVRKRQEDYEAKRKAHEARIPELTEHYRKEARGVIIESELEYWDKIVPIRLGDIYRGMELDNVLDCAKVMRDETLSRIERLRKAYKIFNDAGHSGTSAGLTMAMLRRFCPDGNELADACNEFRYDPGTRRSCTSAATDRQAAPALCLSVLGRQPRLPQPEPSGAGPAAVSRGETRQQGGVHRRRSV